MAEVIIVLLCDTLVELHLLPYGVTKLARMVEIVMLL